MALQTCQENIMVETDSLELLAMSRSKTRDCSSLGMLMEDLRILLASDRIISFTKIPRLQNTSSHELARFSMLNNITEFWLGSAPESVMSRILRDCNNTLI